MNNVVSPCISVCVLNRKTGLCEGCWRTREEIAGWRGMGNDERWSVIERLRERREKAGIGRKRRRPRRERAAS